jgi:hypothetical protein
MNQLAVPRSSHRAVFVPFDEYNVRQQTATTRINQRLAKLEGERTSATPGNMRHQEAIRTK